MNDTLATAGLARRLAAAIYDLLPLLALWMVGTALLMPFTRAGIEPHTAWFQAYLLSIAFAYYGWSWKRGGQTIGMKAWRLRAVSDTGAPLTWPQVMLRFVIACLGTAMLGAGLVAAIFDARRRMWHDTAARTVVVVLPKDSK